MRFTYWMQGKYAIEHSDRIICISYKGEYIQIHGREPVSIFDVFTDFCENENAIDKYFDIAKLPSNEG